MIKLKTLLSDSSANGVLSEAIQYHITNKISITENIFRGQSRSNLNLIVEARKLYESGHVTFTGLDEILFNETDLGKFEEYSNKQVPLDYPFIQEGSELVENDPCWDGYEMIGMKKKNGKDVPNCVPKTESVNELTNPIDKITMDVPLFLRMLEYAREDATNDADLHDVTQRAIELMQSNHLLSMKDYDSIINSTTSINKQLAEAEYRGKKVELNKPKRGGSKKFYVYTKNEKGNVVKVSFGDTSGLSVKLKDPKAVKSFVARHKCGTGEKKWTARYWSCRLPRYASALGLTGKTSGYW